mgnify:CR=1 FL=1
MLIAADTWSAVESQLFEEAVIEFDKEWIEFQRLVRDTHTTSTRRLSPAGRLYLTRALVVPIAPRPSVLADQEQERV